MSNIDLEQHRNRHEGLIIPDGVDPQRVEAGMLVIDGVRYDHLITKDFPPDDPWSVHMMRVIDAKRHAGKLRGRKILELGVGDGRNILHAGRDIKEVAALDLEGWRTKVAEANLKRNPITAGLPLNAITGHAVAVLQDWEHYTGQSAIDGYIFACLPQSPEGANAADRYVPDKYVEPYDHEWGKYGLSLNAAVLDTLRKRATDEARVVLMLSHRVPKEVRRDFIKETGWEIAERHRTRAQQDPDTPIGWVEAFDDGDRFQEHVPNVNLYLPISAVEAEKRRKTSLDSGVGRGGLNVYHGLSAYELKPRRPGNGKLIVDFGALRR